MAYSISHFWLFSDFMSRLCGSPECNWYTSLNILKFALQSARRHGIVVMDFDCYTGDRSSIPTHGDSHGKWMNLSSGQPMLCEGNWVVSPRYWRDIVTYIVSIIAKMGFSASCNSTTYIQHKDIKESREHDISLSSIHNSNNRYS